MTVQLSNDELLLEAFLAECDSEQEDYYPTYPTYSISHLFSNNEEEDYPITYDESDYTFTFDESDYTFPYDMSESDYRFRYDRSESDYTFDESDYTFPYDESDLD